MYIQLILYNQNPRQIQQQNAASISIESVYRQKAIKCIYCEDSTTHKFEIYIHIYKYASYITV